MEIYRTYRPERFKDVVGQEEAISTLQNFLDKGNCPHALLLTGPSGCGKTTSARILAKKLGCHEMDYKEIDAGGKGGIDTIRSVKDKISASPMMGRTKFYVIDEAHELTRPAQEHMLKVAEECPSHAYILLSTTDPKDLIRTIVTRFTEVKFNGLDPDAMKSMIGRVTQKKGVELPESVIEEIIEVAEGSGRFALNVLGKVIDLDDEEKMLKTIRKTEVKRSAWGLAMMLMGWGQKGNKTTWTQLKEYIQSLEGQEEPEQIRRLILKCLQGECLKGGKQAQRAAVMYEAFRDPYYDVGFAGLVFSCYACTTG